MKLTKIKISPNSPLTRSFCLSSQVGLTAVSLQKQFQHTLEHSVIVIHFKQKERFLHIFHHFKKASDNQLLLFKNLHRNSERRISVLYQWNFLQTGVHSPVFSRLMYTHKKKIIIFSFFLSNSPEGKCLKALLAYQQHHHSSGLWFNLWCTLQRA